mmetsp:Transcript_14954/g.23203  ORF Transcript_14954/g.23203 Transcript_14954/m.23203 type:complete len:519 (-) Transcript_14954:163-1719(-)|eukprot:CAMPEP_0196814556 /NCGR_PEP_ID=MMETSP1362-20130617/44115_1 /TAXON_ID=163516 /ORGANISM="Leptocylindrus danicus, Strain CCMP1856" /LENGTH=518 /DNA_ID=CAMNT_0042191209 /DNA_START=803 /DNA_END=2359 /DNA_ORIENTATION=+
MFKLLKQLVAALFRAIFQLIDASLRPLRSLFGVVFMDENHHANDSDYGDNDSYIYADNEVDVDTDTALNLTVESTGSCLSATSIVAGYVCLETGAIIVTTRCCKEQQQQQANSSFTSDISMNVSFLDRSIPLAPLDEENDDNNDHGTPCVDGDVNDEESITDIVIRDDDRTRGSCFSGSKEFNDCLSDSSIIVKEDSEHSSASSVASLKSSKSKAKSIITIHKEYFYMRVCDLSMKMSEYSISHSFKSKVHPVTISSSNSKSNKVNGLKWLGLGDDENLSKSAVAALLQNGLHLARVDVCENTKWSPDKNTTRILKLPPQDYQEKLETSMLFWTGKVVEKKYGSDHPVIKYRGIVDVNPRELAVLLLDSDRVKVYNNSTLGRTDLQMFQKGLDTEGQFGTGEVKIVKNITKVPFVNRTLELMSLMHGRSLPCDDGGEAFIIVTRAVSRDSSGAGGASSEILIGANHIKSVKGKPGKSEITCISHVLVPMVPSFLSSKIAFQGANDFLSGIRQYAANKA